MKLTRKILACDPSLTNLGLCIMDTETRHFKTKSIPRPRKDMHQTAVISHAYHYIHALLRDKDYDLFVLEDYAFALAGKSRAITVLAELSGCLKLAAMDAGRRCITVPSTTWKKVVFGKGNLKKTEIYQAAVARWPKLDGRTQDEIDAYCLAYATATVIHNDDDRWHDSANPIYTELRRVGCFVTRMVPMKYD